MRHRRASPSATSPSISWTNCRPTARLTNIFRRTDARCHGSAAARQARCRTVLARNLPTSRCDTLSGGEKARLLFALATFHGPHILVLDEPTNHLDVDSREALIMAINDYEGAVILISHDRHIIETCADQLWLVKDGTVKPFDGDMDDYTDLVLGKTRGARKTERPASPAPSNTPKEPKPRPAAVQKRLQQIEFRISALKDKLTVLDRALADQTLYAEEPQKAADFMKLRSKLAIDLDQLETDWLQAHG